MARSMLKYINLLFFISLAYVISLAQTPTADFSADPLSACTGELINFTNSSSTNGGAEIQDYVWDFGDGNTSNDESTSHSYALPGTYTVTLVITNSIGEADAEVKPNYITILPSPNISFTPLGLGCTVPLTLSIENNSDSGPEYSYDWDFGNGNTSSDENPPDQTYNTTGNYIISLTIVNTNTQCTSIASEEITISNFQAGFSFPSTVCVGEMVNFIDNSTAGANQWEWNFGGQGTSSEQDPSFSFAAAGVYNIQLSSDNTNSGCSGSISQEINVEATPNPSFTSDITTDCSPASINFVNTSSGGVEYEWDFGNGNTFSGQSPPNQTYNSSGTYSVTLSMVTENGCTGTTTLTDYITIEELIPGFTSDETGGCNPLEVQFTDTSSTPNAANPITEWNWDFGNGETFSGQNPPIQTYTNGLYDITLIITTSSGCTGSITLEEYISVGELNEIDFTVDTTTNCIKRDFNFSSFVSTTPSFPDSSEINYFWDFGDGNSSEANPTFQYQSDTGYFDVLLVVDYRGCIDSLQIDSLIFIPAPISIFSPEEALVCNPSEFPVEINFNDEAVHGEESDDILMIYEWGDGTPDDVLDDPELDDIDQGDTSHEFNDYGTYSVEQVIHNYTTGCSDSSIKVVNISMVTPSFSLSNDSICKGDSLFLFDASSSWSDPPTPHPLTAWEYNMGNGDIVNTGPNVSYAYTVAGDYTVTLNAINSVGCSASATLPVTVLANPFAVISADDNVGCSPFLVTFSNNSISLNGLDLISFEYTFTDDSSNLVVNNNNPIEHTFNGSGIYYAQLTATDEFGCQSTPASIPITITKPNAFFSVQNVICNGGNINTSNTSDGLNPLTYEWLVDGNSFSNDENLNTTFNEPSVPVGETSFTHSLELVVTDANGCTDTSSNLITISIPTAYPNYSFTGAATNSEGEYTCPPLFGTYTDSSFSYGTIESWVWNFGNGNQSVLEDPSNTYALPGTFTLILSITDSYGCVDDTTLTNYVTIGGPSAEPFWFQSADECSQGANFILNNPINVNSVIWNLGDGNVIEDTVSFYYNYPNPDTYFPEVTILDDLGCEVIYPLNDITVSDDGLEAFFTATPNPADQDEIISFVDGSSFDGTSIISWEWDFGNGQFVFSGTDQSQTQSYSVSGQYPVNLTVTDAIGCVDEYELIININDPVIWIPNVFTPNGDGVNDLFELPFDGFKSFDIFILNRWGNVMWNQTNQTGVHLWDGTDNGGEKCVDGVYYYQLQGEMYGGTLIDQHGFVTVIESE
tara:strand:- start:4228 stop:8010 length:3783 start_codon:yes stop_codon:yes gene_type:complete